mgnify:CR=1 FL=1
MCSMPTPPVSAPSHRAITVVLVLWLCVLAAGVWAPVARAHMAAQGLERVCSGNLQPRWEPSPASHAAQGDALSQALRHHIDCSLCMPTLAPPSDVCVGLPHSLPHQPPAVDALQPRAYITLAWPLPRGPPL